MIILSIDPGLYLLGWAVLIQDEKGIALHRSGVLRLKKSQSIPSKLYEIYTYLFGMIVELGVTNIALETPFLGKNAATYLKLGYIRGILYLLCEIHNIVPIEFSPQEVKKIITGNGASDKEVVLKVIQRLFPALRDVYSMDESDAIAVGVCALRLLKK